MILLLQYEAMSFNHYLQLIKLSNPINSLPLRTKAGGPSQE